MPYDKSGDFHDILAPELLVATQPELNSAS